MASDVAGLEDGDRALLDRLADRVVELHLEIPAILTIESARPLAFVAGQAMVFFEPLVQSMFAIPDYRNYSRLIERREALEYLLRRIETQVDARPGRSRRPAPPAAP